MISKKTFVATMELNDRQFEQGCALNHVLDCLAPDCEISEPPRFLNQALVLLLAEIFDVDVDIIRKNQFISICDDNEDFEDYEQLYDYLFAQAENGGVCHAD